MAGIFTVADLSRQLRAGTLSPLRLARECLHRIEIQNPTLNAFIAPDPSGALEAAADCEARLRSGRPRSPLEGIPVALKDLIDVAGQPTTAGLREPWKIRAEQDAFVVTRLRAAGAVVLGKTNLHEAAMGATTDNPHHGKTRNPWQPECTPGGSSGGSAAAVAAGLCPAALGTDTMGSVRIPAAYCGLSGLKPTIGRIGVRGVTPLCPALDVVGPLARDVTDLALLLDAMGGFDEADPFARPAPDSHARRAPDAQSLAPLTERDPGEFTLAVLEPWGADETEPAVAAAFARALGTLEKAGCRLTWHSVPGLERARRHGLILIEAEAARIHAGLLARHPESLGADVRSQLEYGAGVPENKLAAAREQREQLTIALERILAGADAIVSPATPQAAFPFGGTVPANQALFAAPASLGGFPALSLPMGFDDRGLPLGLQLTGARWGEKRLLELGRVYQSLTDWHRRSPPGYS